MSAMEKPFRGLDGPEVARPGGRGVRADFEQAVLDRLDQIVALLQARLAQAVRTVESISPATQEALRWAPFMVSEPARPGEVGFVWVREYKVRKTLKSGLTLDLYAVGRQWAQFAFATVHESEWGNPVKVPPEWGDLGEGDTGKCQARVTFRISERVNSKGNPYRDVLAVELLLPGMALPPLAVRADADVDPADLRSASAQSDAPEAAGTEEPAAPPPTAAGSPNRPSLTSGAAAGADMADGAGATRARVQEDPQTLTPGAKPNGDTPPRVQKDPPPPVERALPPPPRQKPFDRGAALAYWLNKGGLLIAELKQRGFPDALTAAGFLVDLEEQEIIDRVEDANERARKVLDLAAQQTADFQSA